MKGWEAFLNLIPLILFFATLTGLLFKYIRGFCTLLAWPTYIGLREMSSTARRWKWYFKIPKGGNRRFIMDIAASCCSLSSLFYLQKVVRSPAQFSKDMIANANMLDRPALILILLAMAVLVGISHFTPEEEARPPWSDRFKDIPTPKFWETIFKS